MNHKLDWPYQHRHSSELWDIAAEILSELSHRDQVNFRIIATPESVNAKIKNYE
jgi:hypothetical protein